MLSPTHQPTTRLSFGGSRDASAVSRFADTYVETHFKLEHYNRHNLYGLRITLLLLTFRTQMLNVKYPVQTMLAVWDTILTIIWTNVGFMRTRIILRPTQEQTLMESRSTKRCLVQLGQEPEPVLLPTHQPTIGCLLADQESLQL